MPVRYSFALLACMIPPDLLRYYIKPIAATHSPQTFLSSEMSRSPAMHMTTYVQGKINAASIADMPS